MSGRLIGCINPMFALQRWLGDHNELGPILKIHLLYSISPIRRIIISSTNRALKLNLLPDEEYRSVSSHRLKDKDHIFGRSGTWKYLTA